jgi:hypothetical protein
MHFKNQIFPIIALVEYSILRCVAFSAHPVSQFFGDFHMQDIQTTSAVFTDEITSISSAKSEHARNPLCDSAAAYTDTNGNSHSVVNAEDTNLTPLCIKDQPQSPFSEDASNTISGDKSHQDYETIAKIRAALKAAESRTYYVKLFDPDIVQLPAKNGNLFDAIEFYVANFTTIGEGKTYKRRKPLFTKEGKLMASLVPFDPDSLYRVTAVQNTDGFSEWVNVEKVV